MSPVSSIYKPSPKDFKDLEQNVIILDIETEGLNKDVDNITCMGILTKDHGVNQFLPSRNYLFDFLSNFDTEKYFLVTYNGKSFDIPFIEKCLSKPFPNFKHIDLSIFCKMLNNNRYISKSEACNRIGGFYTGNRTSGLYTARIYKNDLVSSDDHIQMLQHNAMDLCDTYRLYLSLLRFPDFKEWVEKEIMM